jgi:SAM-dependent methyltransferase
VPTVDLPYVDAALDHLASGGPPTWWRHLHWGLFDDAETDDDSPERYYAAAEALVDRILEVGEVGDGTRVLDVGCGFGGTLDHLARRHPGCRLAGLNIDGRQLRWARRLVGDGGDGGDGDGDDRDDGGDGGDGDRRVSWIQADGCALPVAERSLDHVLAVECIFHFPSRRSFFREAARVLRPGGTLALSDFLVAPGALGSFVEAGEAAGLGERTWYGQSRKPLTSAGYGRLARGAGFDLLVDDDVTARTLPTYAARRRLYREAGASDGVSTIDGLEALAVAGGWEYHVLSFRKRL